MEDIDIVPLGPAHSGSANIDLGVILRHNEKLTTATSQERERVVTEDRLILDIVHMARGISHLQSPTRSKNVPYHERSVTEAATAENLKFFAKASSVIARFIGTLKIKLALVIQEIISRKTS